ncbi:MAG: AzlD domain-containing protein [Desulfobacteraceae bacterium]|nr:AzlD domain-containing protein [Desulfobacteraceae bacterium]
MTDITAWHIWTLLFIIGIGTFLLRLSFIQLFADRQVPAAITRLLRFVPPAALSALILPAIVTQDGGYAFSLFNDRIPAAMIAAIVAVLTRNTLYTICSGMAVLWLYQALL